METGMFCSAREMSSATIEGGVKKATTKGVVLKLQKRNKA